MIEERAQLKGYQLGVGLNMTHQGSTYHEALFRISLAINSQEELKAIFKLVVENTCLLVGCEDAGLVLWDAHKGRFETGASTTPVGEGVAQRVRRSGGASRWIIDHGQPVIVTDTSNDPFTANDMIPEGGVRAYIGVPIQHQAERLGVLYALFKTNQSFEGDELTIVQELASMAAIAIQNARQVAALRELNRFKESMMQLAAHDFRSPLSLIMGYLDILVEDLRTLSPDQANWVAVIRRSLQRLEELSSGILDYGRLTAFEDINRFRCSLYEIAEQVIEDFTEVAGQKNQALTLAPAPGALFISADRVLIREALGNLVANALKYTPEGGHIALETGSHDQEVSVAVRDDGPGIDAREMPRLFQPFTRLSTAGGGSGSGLGLSLVKIILERHGGRVEVESTLGEGSTFTIFLPAYLE